MTNKKSSYNLLFAQVTITLHHNSPVLEIPSFNATVQCVHLCYFYNICHVCHKLFPMFLLKRKTLKCSVLSLC